MDRFAEALLILAKLNLVVIGFGLVMMVRAIIRNEREIARRRRMRQLRREQAAAPRARYRVARRGWGALSQDRAA